MNSFVTTFDLSLFMYLLATAYIRMVYVQVLENNITLKQYVVVNFQIYNAKMKQMILNIQ
jgi:predicted small integral membrane protein